MPSKIQTNQTGGSPTTTHAPTRPQRVPVPSPTPKQNNSIRSVANDSKPK